MKNKKKSEKKPKGRAKKTLQTPQHLPKKKSSTFGQRTLVLIVGLFAFLLYSNTLNHGFVLDDDLVCSQNSFVQAGFSGLPDIFTGSWYEGFQGKKGSYYRPMMLAGFAIEKGIFGHSPKVYHTMNILWYGLAMIILFLLLQKMFSARKTWIPLAIVLLYTAHPLHIEVVANIKSRDEIFALLGLLGMLYGLLCYEEKGEKKWLALSLGTFFFALLSKESSLAFFALIPLTLHFFSANNLKGIAIKSLPYATVAGLYLLIRSLVISTEGTQFGTLDNSLFAAEGLGQQTATAVAMVGKYISLLFFPHPLTYDYSFNQIPIVGWANWQALLSLVVIIAALVYALYSWRKKDKMAYAISFFAITSVITSNLFFLIGATFAERFMFIPSLAFCILLVLIVARFLENPGKQKIAWGILGLLLLFYAGKVVTHNSVWASNQTLFSHGIEVSSNSTRVNAYYAKALYDSALATQDSKTRSSRLQESVTYFEKSIQILPSYTQAYQNMGLALEELNQYDKALGVYQRGIATNPEYSPLMYNAGALLFNQGKYTQALTFLQDAIGINPNNAAYYSTLGGIQHKLKTYDAAIASYKHAHELQPSHIPYLGNLVSIHRELNQIESAIFYDKQIKALQ